MRIICDQCAAEPALFDHLDVSGAEPVFKRLCEACGDVEKARWDAEQRRRPGLFGVILRDRQAA